MQNIISISRKFLVWYTIFFVVCANAVSLVIVDTNGKDAYYYRNLIILAKSVGFTVEYKNLYDILEDHDINHYDAAFFMLSPAMLTKSTWDTICCLLPFQRTTAITDHCLQLLRTFIAQRHKAIGLILPSTLPNNHKTCHAVEQTLYDLGQLQCLTRETKIAVTDCIKYLLERDASVGSLFGTSLITAAPASSCPTLPTPGTDGRYVPYTISSYHPLVQKALPLGLLLSQVHQENIYLLSKLSAYTFADSIENFFRNPLDFSHRTALLKAAQDTLQSFYDAALQHAIPTSIAAVSFPASLTLASLQGAKQHTMVHQKKQIDHARYGWMLHHPISCAWLDPYDFFGHEDGKQQLKKIITEKYPHPLDDKQLQAMIEQLALQRGIRMLYDGNFNLLWFECVPEWYLSPHGIRKDQKTEYIERIKKIGTALRTFFQCHRTPLPKVFIGLNMTSNFKSHPVAHPVMTLGDTSLSKIPAPFDMHHFWQPEVIDVFTTFVATFKDSFPIDGVFFDFEMYHAQDQSGGYTDTMDFSDSTWQLYCTASANKEAALQHSVKQRLAYLQRTKNFKNYFKILEHASYLLGKTIKQKFRTLLPNLLFAAYAPTLPSCWFYRGVMAGLSSSSEPLILATFNTDYQSHRAWLAQHNMYVLHGAAVMLSKLQTPQDKEIISNLLTHHDFLWYNRPSRMIYAYTQEQLNTMWWGVEATSASCQFVTHLIRDGHTAPQQIQY